MVAEETNKPIAVPATDVPWRPNRTVYPEPFATRVAGRDKRQLGDFFGLKNFGVNLTRLKPGAASSMRHSHAKQDEFVYVLEGTPTLHTNEGSMRLEPGMCVGFPAATGNAHHLVNDSGAEVVYLEIGDRTPGEEVVYPDDDLQIVTIDGKRVYAKKDGTPY